MKLTNLPSPKNCWRAVQRSSLKIKLAVAAGLAALFSSPLARATTIPPFGDIRSDSWSIGVFGVVAIGVALLIFHKWLHMKSVALPLLLIVGGSLVLVAANDGGFFHAGGAGAASIGSVLPGTSASPAPGAASMSSLAWDPALYMPTTSITFKAVDANPAGHAAISPTYDLYCVPATSASGYCPVDTNEQDAVTGAAVAVPGESAATMTSGASTTADVWQANIYGCSLKIHMSLTGYYESLQTVPAPNAPPGAQTACYKFNGNGYSSETLAPLQLKKQGTFALTQNGGGSTLTCAAAADCVFTMQVATSVPGTYLEHVAVKVGTLTNATINQVDSTTLSSCHIETGVQGTDTIIVIDANGGEVSPSYTPTCAFHVSRASGSSGGSFVLTADDLYKQYSATEFVTNSNILNAAASSALTISFA